MGTAINNWMESERAGRRTFTIHESWGKNRENTCVFTELSLVGVVLVCLLLFRLLPFRLL